MLIVGCFSAVACCLPAVCVLARGSLVLACSLYVTRSTFGGRRHPLVASVVLLLCHCRWVCVVFPRTLQVLQPAATGKTQPSSLAVAVGCRVSCASLTLGPFRPCVQTPRGHRVRPCPCFSLLVACRRCPTVVARSCCCCCGCVCFWYCCAPRRHRCGCWWCKSGWLLPAVAHHKASSCCRCRASVLPLLLCVIVSEW